MNLFAEKKNGNGTMTDCLRSKLRIYDQHERSECVSNDDCREATYRLLVLLPELRRGPPQRRCVAEGRRDEQIEPRRNDENRDSPLICFL